MSAFTAPLELRDLAFRYAMAVDNRDAAQLIPIFTTTGGVLGFGENPIEFRGEAGLTTMIGQVAASFQRTMHNVFNQTFEIADDGRVEGMTYCIASHILPGVDWVLLDMALRYHDSYAQTDGLWRFHERRLEVLWVENRPVQKFTPAMMSGEPGRIL